MTYGYQTNTDIGQVRGLGGYLVYLKCGKLEGLLRNFIHTAVSPLCLYIDVNVNGGVIFSQYEFTLCITTMIKCEYLFPRELIVESEFLIKETSSDILIVA